MVLEVSRNLRNGIQTSLVLGEGLRVGSLFGAGLKGNQKEPTYFRGPPIWRQAHVGSLKNTSPKPLLVLPWPRRVSPRARAKTNRSLGFLAPRPSLVILSWRFSQRYPSWVALEGILEATPPFLGGSVPSPHGWLSIGFPRTFPPTSLMFAIGEDFQPNDSRWAFLKMAVPRLVCVCFVFASLCSNYGPIFFVGFVFVSL